MIWTAKQVVCREPGCAYQDKPRLVHRPIVGEGVYLNVPMVCECGVKPEEYYPENYVAPELPPEEVVTAVEDDGENTGRPGSIRDGR